MKTLEQLKLEMERAEAALADDAYAAWDDADAVWDAAVDIADAARIAYECALKEAGK
jgi:hypothetical protein